MLSKILKRHTLCSLQFKGRITFIDKAGHSPLGHPILDRFSACASELSEAHAALLG